ncbi:gamma-glutamylcyclotransferase family protein [Pedobacter sp. P351]|uniref:gamma-glutamylcyclotransferase family protein n=1 Tax=Pedobacter superstes TaxID=3133441 RepID=UPI0030AD930A
MDLLFVYGTLLHSANFFGSYLQNNSRHINKGKFKGTLYDIGEYPGAVYDKNISTYVYGDLVSVFNREETFKILDEYEGYGNDEIQPNEFIRKIIEVEIESNNIQCWTYLYNLPVNQFLRIDSGNYKDYLSKRI